jgi:aspartyl-tRNA(Asn)/glutamyl-tRNA(Gln) amidotransferase subunit C
MLKREEVKHIAHLARLGLKEKEIKKFQSELSKILDYIEKLKEVETENVEPMSYPIEVKNVFRKDQERSFSLEGPKLLELAPETQEGYLKVKKII